MAKSIRQHSDFAVGYRRQDITFVYVQDVVQAVFLACEKGRPERAYFLSDGQVYQSTTFSDLIRKELGNPWCIRIPAPIWLLRIITACGDFFGRMTNKMTALNNDKFNILRQRNWRCDIEPARRELGFSPQVKLKEGVHLAVKWYKEKGWI
jgi:nucleoside-diphosphate-sugar epimerase